MRVELEAEECLQLFSAITDRLLDEAGLSTEDRAAVKRWRSAEIKTGSDGMNELTAKINADLERTLQNKAKSAIVRPIEVTDIPSPSSSSPGVRGMLTSSREGTTVSPGSPEPARASGHQHGDARPALGDLHAVRDDPEVEVVIFGAGDRAFSAGADIKEFGTAPTYADARRARRERDLWGFMLSLDCVFIAAIQGYALGAGIELPMCCDIRIASEDARMGLPEVTLGYIPSAGTQTLPRHVPPGIAMEMILTGDPIDAQTALRHGLLQKVVPHARLYAEAESMARRILRGGPQAVRLAKRAVVEGLEMPLEDALALEGRLAERALLTADAREGLRARVESREPAFAGA
jgi:enoyl-CoA hydratase/carnithine racemase